MITGAGWGIGRACSTRFAREGAALTLIDTNAGTLESTAEECRELGAQTIARVADVSDAPAVDAAVGAAVDCFGGIDVLVNCAVYRVVRPFAEITPEELLRSFEVNVAGYYFTAQRVVPHMRARGGGSIVNVTSQLGFVGAPALSAYCTMKGAQINMTRALALELAPDNIRVNGVAPGPTDTEGLRAVVDDDATVLESRLAGIPMHRLGQPDEIAEVTLFLASDRSSFVTGHNVVADGGYLIH